MAAPPASDPTPRIPPESSSGMMRDPILGPSISPPPPPPYGTTAAGGAPATRPVGVTILAVLAAIGAIFAFIGAMASFAGGAILGASGAEGFGALVAVIGVLLLAYAAAAAAVAFGLLKRARWAWYVAVGLAALGALFGVMSLLGLDIVSFVVQVGVNGFVLWYLLKPEVQAWFGVRYGTPWKYKTQGVA